jgi:hypothetical protein
VPALALLINPPLALLLYHGATDRVVHPVYAGHSLHHLYRLRGLGGYWVHEHRAFGHDRTAAVVIALGVLISAAALVGLARLAWGCRGLLTRAGWRDAAPYRHRCLLALALLALALLPLAVHSRGPAYPYQVCKLLGSFAAVFCLAVAVAGHGFGSQRRRADLACAALAVVACCGLAGTASLTWRETSPELSPRSFHHVMLQPDYRDVQQVLRRCRGRPIVLACGPGTFHNCWLAYAARHNRVWLVNPCVNDGQLLASAAAPPQEPNLRPLAEGGHLTDLSRLPPEVLVVTGTYYSQPQVELIGDRRLIAANALFQVWALGPGPYEIRPLPGAWRQSSLVDANKGGP